MAMSEMATSPTHPLPDSVTGLADSGRRVFAIEAQALTAVAARLDGEFTVACRLMLETRGRVVCTGMGKSGHIARKIAATLASTGTPAFYVHPGEAAVPPPAVIPRDPERSEGDRGISGSHCRDAKLGVSRSSHPWTCAIIGALGDRASTGRRSLGAAPLGMTIGESPPRLALRCHDHRLTFAEPCCAE